MIPQIAPHLRDYYIELNNREIARAERIRMNDERRKIDTSAVLEIIANNSALQAEISNIDTSHMAYDETFGSLLESWMDAHHDEIVSDHPKANWNLIAHEIMPTTEMNQKNAARHEAEYQEQIANEMAEDAERWDGMA